MPLMVGDWLKGTSGMKAEMKGVYINLLLHQWDHGFLPSDLEELALITPEVGKVWDKLKEKFPESEPGKLQNIKLEEVRNFWAKQKKNGTSGGRPKRNNPDGNPNTIPKENPNPNHQNDLDLDNEVVLEYKEKEKKEKPIIIQATIPRESESLDDVEYWTKQILDGNDPFFLNMVRGASLTLDDHLENLARDHLGKCARYNWHDRMTTQQAFRHSLLNYITENLKTGKEKINGKPQASLTDLNKFRNGNV